MEHRTYSHLHRSDKDEPWLIFHLVSFKGNYSGWTYFMGKIYVLATKLSNRQPTSASEIVQVTLILRLMNQLFAKKDDLIKYLNDHLKGTMGRYARARATPVALTHRVPCCGKQEHQPVASALHPAANVLEPCFFLACVAGNVGCMRAVHQPLRYQPSASGVGGNAARRSAARGANLSH